jgi:hypothetical protein
MPTSKPKMQFTFKEPVARPDLQSTSKARLLPADMDLDEDGSSTIAIRVEFSKNAQSRQLTFWQLVNASPMLKNG